MLTIRLDKDLDDLLTRLSRRLGRSRCDIAREALRRHLGIWEFESLRDGMTPSAKAQGFLVDDDVFDEVS